MKIAYCIKNGRPNIARCSDSGAYDPFTPPRILPAAPDECPCAEWPGDDPDGFPCGGLEYEYMGTNELISVMDGAAIAGWMYQTDTRVDERRWGNTAQAKHASCHWGWGDHDPLQRRIWRYEDGTWTTTGWGGSGNLPGAITMALEDSHWWLWMGFKVYRCWGLTPVGLYEGIWNDPLYPNGIRGKVKSVVLEAAP